ncbi:MAG: SAM-dependent methyltransferase, partial [Deferribacteraceae bacterium]|nr:SAM-dependent methyltransferase [Deferribacteraceae bacterium]
MKNNLSVLVETKAKQTKKDEKQLFAYTALEEELTGNNIIAILANTEDDTIKVWQNGEPIADKKIKTISEYERYFTNVGVNDKQKVISATYRLNEMLHEFGIGEALRSQFVGTCLLAIKNRIIYNKQMTNSQIIGGIRSVLESLLNQDIARAEKLVILDKKVLREQDVCELSSDNLVRALDYINERILPFINDETDEGQDLLNLFFTTFNKYVGKKDKNQAFTPDHIVHFMCKVAKINKNSRILDPTCGSGSFLVQAMTQALRNCETDAERNHVKAHQIYGIEYEEKAFGLSATNMLIHGDGNSNVRKGNCFEQGEWIRGLDISVVLMNPPYNSPKKYLPNLFSKSWNTQTKSDPTKGFYFMNYIANIVNKGRLLVLLVENLAILLRELVDDLFKFFEHCIEHRFLAYCLTASCDCCICPAGC